MTDAGVGLHAPVLTVSDAPCWGVPPTTGCAVETRSGVAFAIGPTRPPYAVPVPPAAAAVTRSPIVPPTSFAATVYVDAVAPEIAPQWLPVASHRNQRYVKVGVSAEFHLPGTAVRRSP